MVWALASLGPAQAQTSAEVKVAIIGDQGLTDPARDVLQLIADEGADAVLHNGDFDYQDDPEAWEAQINAFLGADFPYFASAGNHDASHFYEPGGYQDLLEARMNRLGIPWTGDLGVQCAFEWNGIFFVLTAPSVFGPGDGYHDAYIREALANDDSIWRISGWHENMREMQVEGKGSSTGWGVYEESRRGGAIITTGHAHVYARTHLLSSTQLQQVADASNDFALSSDDSETPEDEGLSFVVVSGIAGRGIRSQQRGGDWWGSIYTRDQDAQPGALFGVFNVGGNPTRARFYFKNVAGEVIDEFFVTSAANARLVPTLVSEDAMVEEGDVGSRDAEVNVSLLAPDGNDVSVDFATADLHAEAGSDYETTSGRLVFEAGETQQTIRIPVYGDTLEEEDELFRLWFSNPVNAEMPQLGRTVTILDDDAPALATLTASAGNGGTVQLSPPGGVYTPGTAVTVTAVPAEGYFFDHWTGALGGGTNPQVLVVEGSHSVAAHFALDQPVLREVQSGSSSDQLSVATGQALEAADGHLYLAAIASKPHTEVLQVSGLGLVWSLLREQCGGRGQTGVSVWQSEGTPDDDDFVQATFAAAPRSAIVSVSSYEAASDLQVANVASANTTGPSGACSGGADTSSYAFDLPLNSVSSLVYLATAMRSRDHLPGPGFVEQVELYEGALAGNETGLSIAEADAGPPPSMTVAGAFDGSVDWAAVALELSEPRFHVVAVLPPDGGSISLDPPGGTYLAGTTLTLTATPDPGFVFSGWQSDAAGLGNPAALVIDSDTVVGAGFVPGFSIDVEPTPGGSVTLEPPAAGPYPMGSVVSVTAVPDPGYVFAGWSGDLSGHPNPAAVLDDAQVVAQFVPLLPEFEEIATGSSSESNTVATATPLEAVADDLYLAAVSTKPHAEVSGVSGLGLVWTPVRSQCSGRSQTGLTLWQARGQAGAAGSVAVSLESSVRNAVIAVSRYSGTPQIGAAVSGNTQGVSGICSGGQDGAAYAFDLDTTAPSSRVYVAVAARRADHLPGPGFVEHAQLYAGTLPGERAGLSVAGRTVEGPAQIEVTGTTDSTVDWAVISIEIRALPEPSGGLQLAAGIVLLGALRRLRGRPPARGSTRDGARGGGRSSRPGKRNEIPRGVR